MNVSKTRPGQRALRRGRVSLPGRAYVLTTATQRRRPLFADLYAGRKVVRELRRLHEEGRVTSLAYVLMPDHLHWLFALAPGATLSQIAALFKGRSSRALGRGGVWQRGFYDHLVRDDEDLRLMARYIVANPLRAGLVTSVRSYPLWDAAWLDDTLSIG